MAVLLILESALVDLTRVILELGIRYNLAQGLVPDADVTVAFDDSIIVDTDKQNESMKQDVDDGYIRPELYVAKKYGVSEGQARKMMPGAAADKGENDDERQENVQ